MTTYASLFTGGGLADWGARAAGLTPVWGVEYDPTIAAVAQQNDDTGTVYAADVRAVDYAALPRVDVLHASPPCPNFSRAKAGAAETPTDLELAGAVARAIDAQRPRLVTLENVRAYQDSRSLAVIMATLDALDYHVTTAIVNAADHGVPQTRERLFVLAHAGGWMQAARPLPAPTPWRGWYQAIADLLPTLPASQFAPWQLARLPQEVRQSMLVHPTEMRADAARSADEPSFTVMAGSFDQSRPPSWKPRAFILDCQKAGDPSGERGVTLRDEAEPCFTVTAASGTKRPARAWLVESRNRNQERGDGLRADDEPATTVTTDPSHHPRAWLDAGRVVAMTPRALARFQSVPDAYALPDKASLACRIIGNGVAVEAYRRLLESQLWT